MSKSIANSGFDRGIDFEPIKNKLIDEFNKQYNIYKTSKSTILAGRYLIYLLIEIIQLRNGSRITEAINAYKLFSVKGIDQRVIVKLCKSETRRNTWVLDKEKNCKVQKEITTKLRPRDMMFPREWLDEIDINKLIFELYSIHEDLLNDSELRLTICKFMNRKFKCNTHSLRYALINYLMYVEKRPLPDIAQFVGHTNTNQLVTYTQRKNSNQIFDLKI